MDSSPAQTPKPPEHNQTGIDYRAPMPWPKVRGPVIDFHCHLLAARHADVWFEAADHFGIDYFMTLSPLEEAVNIIKTSRGRVQFIAVPKWTEFGPDYIDDWLRRIDAFHNLGSRIVKFHCSPKTCSERFWLDSPIIRPIFQHAKDRGMMFMSHIADPDSWFAAKYTDTAKFGTKDDHYRVFRSVLEEHRGTPWLCAHMGGTPEDLARLQSLLDDFPDLSVDCSATRWQVRELSGQRDRARDFFIRNADRIVFGSDQVSTDDRGYDFLASRFWCHRKMWETAYNATAPIFDPDCPPDAQPRLRGLALPDGVLQKLYHDNAVKLLARIGLSVGDA